jgi:putative MATE family efflux protein
MSSQKPDQSRLQKFLDNPSRALWTLALPIMAGMAIHTAYSVVDMIFVGRLGGDAIVAVAFNMPIFFLVIAVIMGIGSGVTSSIARYLGAKDKETADNCAAHALFMGMAISIFFVTSGQLFGESLLGLLGTPDHIKEMSWSYLSVLVFGMPLITLSGFFRAILAGEGDMKFPTIVGASGTVMNIILDPIFIFGLGMGVKGAATATVISQAMVLLIYIYALFFRQRAYISFNFRIFRLSIDIVKNIVNTGLPASLSMFIMSMGQAAFNKILVYHSDSAVGAIQIAGRIDMVVFMPMLSIAHSLVTLVGMFYGAKRFDRVRFIVKYGITRSVMIVSCGAVFLYLSAPYIVSFFTRETEMHNIATGYLRIIVFIYPLIAIGMASSRILQGLGMGAPMLVVTAVRVLLVSVPLSCLFTFVFHKPVEWVWYSMVCSSATSVVISLSWLRYEFKKKLTEPAKSE